MPVEMPHEGYRTLLYIFNAIGRLQYWPAPLKQAKIMIQKPGKNPTDVASYRPISLLPILSKILTKHLLKRIYRDTNLQEWISSHHFGFRKAHSTIQQCHHIIDIINKAFEEHKYCSAFFLDISQAFDTVRHQGLIYKIKQTLPAEYLNILKSYLSDRHFSVSLNNKTLSLLPMLSGVLQESILGPFLYTLYTADLPQSNKTILCTFADDRAIFTTDSDPTQTSANLQEHLLEIITWT